MKGFIKAILERISMAKASVAAFMGAMFTTLFVNTGIVFAATDSNATSNNDIISNLITKMGSYYSKFLGLSTALALFIIVIGLLWIMLSPSSKGAATPLGWIKKVVVAWVIIQCLAGVLAIANDVISGSNGKISFSEFAKTTSAQTECVQMVDQ